MRLSGPLVVLGLVSLFCSGALDGCEPDSAAAGSLIDALVEPLRYNRLGIRRCCTVNPQNNRESLAVQAARHNGVCESWFVILALAESRGNPHAVSSDGAVGLYQILPKVARDYEDVSADELRYVEVNVRIAAKHAAFNLCRLKRAFPNAGHQATMSLMTRSWNRGVYYIIANGGRSKAGETARLEQRFRDLYNQRFPGSPLH